MAPLCRDERGQSLVVVALSMLLIVAIAAVAIDAATWYRAHHQAQVAADAAALAAANCLANAPNNSCASSSDTTGATNVAVTLAGDNGVAISSADVGFSGQTVSVRAVNTAPAFFANVFGIHRTNPTAAATAQWSPSSFSPCDTPGSACDFMFAHDSSCGSASNGIVLNTSGTTTISGVIQSNANVSGSTSGTPAFSATTYGPNNGSGTCANSVTYSGHNPWATPPIQASADIAYPIDYAKDFPACGGSGQATCGAGGYPSYCTKQGADFKGLIPAPGNIYCASGSGNKSDPSTWSGAITINASSTNSWNDSFVAGTISYVISGQTDLSACGYAPAGYTASRCAAAVPAPSTANYPVFYATGNSASALNVNISGGGSISGDMFVPNGTAQITLSGNKTFVSFIEANDIQATVSGTFQGDGPKPTLAGGKMLGSDSLLQ